VNTDIEIELKPITGDGGNFICSEGGKAWEVAVSGTTMLNMPTEQARAEVLAWGQQHIPALIRVAEPGSYVMERDPDGPGFYLRPKVGTASD